MRSQRGQTAVEFALCATVFFMIVFGLLKVATIYGNYVALQHAARDGSRKGSVTRGTGNANSAAVSAAVTTAVQQAGTFLDPTQMNITVTGLDSNVRPTARCGKRTTASRSRSPTHGNSTSSACPSGRARCRRRPRRSSSSYGRRAGAAASAPADGSCP